MSDYDHHHHAGNHADVLKHVGWLALLAAVRRAKVAAVDTHAGSGQYRTQPQGEWESGVGRLLDSVPNGHSTGASALDRYLARVRRLCPDAPRHLPGSPRLTLDALGPTGTVRLHESDEQAFTKLKASLDRDPRTRAHHGDGWATVGDLPAADEVVVLIDPPYSERDEWETAVEALQRLWRHPASPRVLLWYPVKSQVRPARLRAALREAGIPFVTTELWVQPLEKSATRLAGSGLLWLRPPESALAEVAAAGPAMGSRLEAEPGWSFHVQS
jgi:23S rRNA (adenine2030-N6)-methyltransferase